MRKLQNAAKARSVNIIDRTKAELAATAIQKKARALQARAQAKKLQAQKSVQELLAEKEIQLSEEDQRKVPTPAHSHCCRHGTARGTALGRCCRVL
eukprot:2785067-Rhodomonas_salina.4